jgi:hypothetical protein
LDLAMYARSGEESRPETENLFPKTVPLIEKFHKNWLQYENQKRTLRQTVPLGTGDGGAQSIIAQHSVRDLRMQLQEESTARW